MIRDAVSKIVEFISNVAITVSVCLGNVLMAAISVVSVFIVLMFLNLGFMIVGAMTVGVSYALVVSTESLLLLKFTYTIGACFALVLLHKCFTSLDERIFKKDTFRLN